MTDMTVNAVGLSPAAIQELESLAHPDGSLVASEVIEAAKSEANVLHRYFTWDVEQAARERWLEQARHLIRSYRLRVITSSASGEERDLLVRGYTAANGAGERRSPGTYLPVKDLTGNSRQLVLQGMRREVNALRKKYGHLQEFWDLLDEIQSETAEASG